MVLEHAGMTDFCGIPLLSLRENSITELDLQWKFFGELGAVVLSKLLPSAAAVKSLKCAAAPECSPSCQRPLTRTCLLTVPPTIPCSIANNRIGDKGASALAAILKETQITNLECAAAAQ